MWKIWKREFSKLLHRSSFYMIVIAVGIITLLAFTCLTEAYDKQTILHWAADFWHKDTLRNILETHLGTDSLPTFTSHTELANYYFIFVIGYLLMSDYWPLTITSLFLSTVLLGHEFLEERKSLLPTQNRLSLQTFIAKITKYYLFAFLIPLIWVILYVYGAYGATALHQMPLDYFVRCIILRLYLGTALFSVPLLLTCLTKDMVWSFVLNELRLGLLLLFSNWNIPVSILRIFFPEFWFSTHALWKPVLSLDIWEWVPFILEPSVLIVFSIILSYKRYRKDKIRK